MSTALLHLTGQAEWAAAKDAAQFSDESLVNEGFIHCCTADQLLGVVGRYYSDRTDLIILVLDPTTIGSEVRWEESPPNGSFPHVYGPIATAAVTKVVPLPRGADGTFTLPAEIS